MNEQTVTIRWVRATPEKPEEFHTLLNTWFLGVFTEEVFGYFTTMEEAVAEGNRVQRMYGLEGTIELEK